MRRLILISLLAISCGGGSTSVSPPPPPPPPPPSPVPTALVVQAGDNQSAEAGAAVATAPTVRVTNQQGQPMAGVGVTFAVESGTGSITQPVVSTGSDGLARVGSWILGPGANRLRATAGSLSPVFWNAIGTDPALAVTTVPVTGGTIAVSKPGQPLNGLQLKVPANAFGQPVEIAIRPGATTGLPSRPGLSFASPPVALSSSIAGYTRDAPLEIRVPIAPASGSVLVGILFDPASGAFEVIPAVPTGSGTATVFTRHLDAANLLPPAGAALRAATPRAANTPQYPLIQLVIGQVQYANLAGDIGTTYNPAVDNWEFPYTPLGADFATSLRTGYGLTALSYFRTRRSQGPLARRYQEAPGVVESNPRGIKVSAVASGFYDIDAVFAYYRAIALSAVGAPPGVTRDSVQFVAIKAALYLTNVPQILLANSSGQNGPAITYIVYGTVGNTLKVTPGTTDPNQIQLANVRLLGGRFLTQDFGYVDPQTGQPIVQILSLDQWMFAGASAGAQYAGIDALWTKVADRTIGQPDWAVPRFEVNGDARIKADTIFNWSANNRIWAICDVCAIGFPATANIQPTGPVAGWRVWLDNQGTWSLNSAYLPYKLSQGNGIANINTAPRIQKIGVEFVMAPPPGDYARYIEWKPWVLKTVKLDVTSVPAGPAPLSVFEGANFSLKATYSDPLPSTRRFEWAMGDGRTLITTTPDLTATYPAPAANGNKKTYTVKASFFEGTTLLATGTFDVEVKAPFMQFTIAGAWDPATTPVNGSYGYPKGIGARTPSTATPGLDLVFLSYNLTPNLDFGVLLAIVVPSSHVFAAGQTFTSRVSGQGEQAGLWQLLLAQDQNDVDNSAQVVPKGTGTLRIDAVSRQPDGSFIAQYSFTITNAGGGTIVGSGIGQWR